MEYDDSLISTDVLPLAPRQPSEARSTTEGQLHQPNVNDQATNSDTAEDFEEIPEPHPDWQLNIFLDQIADSITQEEFEKLKHLYRGHGGISDETLNEMRSVRDLFTIMRTRCLLSRENLIYLQAMLFTICRMDLVKEGVEYSRNIGNVIHFHPASAVPENGFKYVKFHVEGRNFRNCTRRYVETIRNRVAAVLFIPSQFVIIAGVEPSSSLLITLMIPEKYVTILECLLNDHSCTADMKELGIDSVEIGKVYNVEEHTDIQISDSDQQKKFANLYQQLERKTKQLEESETERLSLSNQLSDYQSKITELEDRRKMDELVIMTLKNSVEETSDNQDENMPSNQKALQEFKLALKTVIQHDKADIHTLLTANTTIVANRLTKRFSIRQRQLELALEDLQSQLLPLQLELQKLRFFIEIDINEMDKVLLESFKQLMQTMEVSTTIQVEVNEDVLHILRKISNSLRPREKENLVKKYTWNSDDNLKRTIDTDRTSVLACILLKEIGKTNKIVDVETFISQRLTEVGRADLVKKLQDLFRKLKRNTSPAGKAGTTTRSAGREQSAQQEDQAQVLNKIADQVQFIHDTLQKTKNGKGYPCDDGMLYGPPPYSPYPFFN